MKIVVYSPTFKPVLDGTSVQASRLVHALSKRHDVRAIGYAVNRDINFDSKLLDVHDLVERLRPDFVNETGKFPKLSGRGVASRVRETKPEIVQIFGWYQFTAAREIIEAAVIAKSKVYWYAGGLHECHAAFRNKTEYNEIVGYAIKTGVYFIGNSTQDQNIFLEIGVPKENVVLMPPLLPPMAQPVRDWGKPRILSVGRLFDYKKHELLIDVVKRIDSELEVIIAGASDTDYSAGFLARNKNRATIVLDPSDDLISTLYSFSTHFVLPSEIESLGISTLEAIKSGCVAMARHIGGISSYLPAKYLFSSDSELEVKLRALLNPNNAATVHRELAAARESLSDDRIESILDTLYPETPR